ncbi:Membrane-associated protease RseP regulator of RpoE activity in bacteria [Methanonatronarchaeum thermophilum]|uniref:Membrane-associated protease RseP regulator of RpoE activity in bacteria n=1 Tax=Methanonatronarchaeum thermophilum TaxID=1927129 RepID=A0A1Y3GCR8_9EURY|nr:site-2 protease family protein [Methanonatronarchaeum thermophilum]OUJ19238.1 Membrane-associated protease RseP regulator of RpoE activity in bacteria [Methanonatronarchaeum thermophilum]
MEIYYLILAFFAFWIILNILNYKGYLERLGFSLDSALFLAWRTEKGKQLMDYIAKRWRKPLKKLGTLNIILSLAAILIVTIFLAFQLFIIVLGPDLVTDVAISEAILLPGLALPIIFGLIALIVAVVIHEFSHAIYARVENIGVESVGFGLLAVLPLAFVEPKIEDIKQSTRIQKLKMFSSGPASNIYLAAISIIIVFLIITTTFTPVSPGIGVVEVQENSPAYQAGIQEDMIITGVNNQTIETHQEFQDIINQHNPGDTITIQTAQNGEYTLQLGQQDGEPHMGIQLIDVYGLYSVFSNPIAYITPQMGMTMPTLDTPFYDAQINPDIALTIAQGAFWMGLLNFWLGILNMMPIFPLDGGRVFWEIIESLLEKQNTIKNTKKATKWIVGTISIIFIAIYLAPIIYLLMI